MKIFWIICLSFFLAGCARPYYVGVPLVNTEPDQGEPADLKPGTGIRITLKDERVIKASFAKFEDQALYFRDARLEGGKKDEFNEIQQEKTQPTDKLYSVPLVEVALLEADNSGDTTDSVATVVGVAAIVGMGVLLANPDSWMDWD